MKAFEIEYPLVEGAYSKLIISQAGNKPNPSLNLA